MVSLAGGLTMKWLKNSSELFLFGVVMVLVVAVPGLSAWTGICHKRLAVLSAQIAFGSQITHESKYEGFLKDLKAGVIAPDRRGPGWLPPSFHGLTPFNVKGEKLRGKAHIAYRKIINSILSSSGENKIWWFEVGRALHIVQDLCQPFHTGSGNDEGLYHSLYEKEVERRIELLIENLKANLGNSEYEIESFSSLSFGDDSFLQVPFKSAYMGRSDFDNLHRLCRLGKWSEELQLLTERCMLRAVRLGAACINEFDSLKKECAHSRWFSQSCMATASSLCGVLLVLWMHFFIYCRE